MQYSIKTAKGGQQAVVYDCPACGSELESQLEDAGEQYPCPICSGALTVPGEAELRKRRAESAAKVAASEARVRKEAEERRALAAQWLAEQQENERAALEEAERTVDQILNRGNDQPGRDRPEARPRQSSPPSLPDVPPAAPAGDPRRPSDSARSLGVWKIACGVALGLFIFALGAMLLNYVVLPGLNGRGRGVPAVSGAAAPDGTKLTHADEAFYRALKASDADSVRAALQAEPRLYFTAEYGVSTLRLSLEALDQCRDYDFKAQDREFFRALCERIIAAGGDVNEVDGLMQRTALHEVDSPGTVDFLFQKGAKIVTIGGSGTPMHIKASADVYTPALAALLRRGDANAADAEGRTPLHIAAAANAVENVRLLLASGADVNRRDSKGYTPLKRANLSLQQDAARLLKASGGVE